MDERTREILRKITAGVPKNLARNVTKQVIDTSREEMAKEALKWNIPRAEKEKLAKLIDKGAFRDVYTVENKDVTRKIEEYHEREIAQAIQRGALADPRKDPFLREREKRLRDMKR